MKLWLLVVVLLAAPRSVQEPAPPREAPPPGGVRLLAGYRHAAGLGFDSRVGRIWKEGGLEIHYDIGGMAGNWADAIHASELVWKRRQTVAGREVVVAEGKERVVVTFPAREGEPLEGPIESYPANFYAAAGSRADLADLLLMALEYAREP